MRQTITRLRQHPGFMRYFTNTSWLFGEKILRMAIGLFVGVWVARYLGPEQFGLFSYAQSFVGLFAAIATLGLDGIVVRELVKDESRSAELLGTAFGLKLLGAVVVLLLLALAVPLTSNDGYTNILVFIIASSTVFQAFNVVDMYFQAKVLSRFVVFANIVGLFLSSLLKIVLILCQAPLIAFAWTMVFDNAVLAAGFVYFYLVHSRRAHLGSALNQTQTALLSKKKWIFNTQTARALLKDSWPLILSGIVISIYMKIDQVMIQEMLDSEAVGQYAAAVRISEAWYFIPTVVAGSLFPAIVNAKNISEELYYTRLQRLYDLMVWMAIAIALPMTFLSDWVTTLLYGTQYHQSGSVLMIHIWAGVFVFLGVASGKWFVAENLQILSFWRTFNGMLINIILNLILIPKYGIQGAAWATLSSQIVAAYIFDLFNQKTKRIFWMKTRSFITLKIFMKGKINV